jgi:hypothetical protein
MHGLSRHLCAAYYTNVSAGHRLDSQVMRSRITRGVCVAANTLLPHWDQSGVSWLGGFCALRLLDCVIQCPAATGRPYHVAATHTPWLPYGTATNAWCSRGCMRLLITMSGPGVSTVVGSTRGHPCNKWSDKLAAVLWPPFVRALHEAITTAPQGY